MRDPRRTPEPVCDALRKAQTIALVSHLNPDGDTVGSTLALRLGLLQLGKQVTVICRDKIPDKQMLLSGAELYVTPADVLARGERFDLLVTVDVSDEGRVTGDPADLPALAALADDTAQIDHHGTNPGYMHHNDIDAHACATALPMLEVLEQLGVTLTADMAACLYTAITTDTGNLAYGNLDEETFRALGMLAHTGFDMELFNRVLFRQMPKEQLLLVRAALNTLTFHHGGEITSMRLSQADFDTCGALSEHADTVVNYGLNIAGVKMAVLAREAGDGRVKLSLRAVKPWAVDKVAKAFGGGGHAQASGATLQTADVCEGARLAVEAMEKELDGAD